MTGATGLSVLGAGAFGTGLAVALARGGTRVTLWSRRADQAGAMQAMRENAGYLPGIGLPDTLEVTADLARACQAHTLLVAVPMQSLRTFLAGMSWQDRVLVACCKGIELSSHLGPVAVMQQEAPQARHALLTGPSFAADIAVGLPTALTLACAPGVDAKALQQALTRPNLRLYRTTDTIGAELGGALKNVIAIACGVVMGAGLGLSARAALMTRGYAEMQRMALALGARPETLAGLSGFGDLALTCTSDGSRNYRYGLALGQGQTFDPLITVEGAATARSVAARAQETGLDMPITQTVVALMDGAVSVPQAMERLLSRPLKEE